MTRHLAVVSAGLGNPSSTRLLADRLSAAATRALEALGEPVVVDVIELRPLAHALADSMLTGFAPATWPRPWSGYAAPTR